ncbi:MAG: winged helix-turn-helix domain-containing protein [Acidobacteriota bacterium]
MDTLRIADWLLEPDLNQLSGPPGTVHLEPRTTAVLLDLAAHPGEVRSREDILQAVWGDAFVGEAVLTHSVWELRKAFGDDAKNPRFIQTVPRRGYRLVAPILEPGGTVVKTLLVSDLVNSTKLVERLGDERSALLFERCDRLARDLLAEHDGQEIDKTDGYLALFERPVAAVRFALDYHRVLADLSAETQVRIGTRVGVHLGEVVLRENPEPDVAKGAKPLEVEGLAKPLTARLMSLAAAGQTLLTRGAFDVARRAAEEALPEAQSLRWLAHGGYLFNGVEEAVDVFEVGREDAAPLTPPADSKKARRVLADGTILGWRPAPGLEIPQRPHWALEHKLGEGGFGEVWLTRHQKTGARRVFKFCVQHELLRSLQREVTVFRLLQKTLGDRRDIARIVDWNFEEAPYFLEIEHSESGSLLDWAETQGGLDRVPLATRLEIVAQVAEALAAAHSVGVLHKDVKPGNILLGPGRGGAPRAKLTDFGIGRITDKGRLADADISVTDITQIFLTEKTTSSGTRLYLAPEILEGKAATIQADIYALGVVLYQAVVGELDRAVATGWRRNIDDELLAEDIAACIDVTPERRPASALDVAERLRSLEERRQSQAEERRLRQEAEANRLALERSQRRRKVLGWVAAAAVLVLVVVSILAVLANQARREADFQRQQAEDLINFMLGDLRQTLETVGRLDAMGGTAEKVLSYFRAVDSETISSDSLAKYAEAMRQIGQVDFRQGQLDNAEEIFRQAASLAQRLAEQSPNNLAWQADLADSRFWIGYVLWQRGDLDGAEAEFEIHRAIYDELVGLDPVQADWRLELAMGHSNLAYILEARGDTAKALEYERSHLAHVSDLVAIDPANTEWRFSLAGAHNRVGALLEVEGNLRGALVEHRTDLEIMQLLVAEAPENTLWLRRRANSHGYVGRVLWMLGETEAALTHFRAEVAGTEELSAIEPANVGWLVDTVRGRLKIGRALGSIGKDREALARARESLADLQALKTQNPELAANRSEVALGRQILGDLLAARGDNEAALTEARAASRILEELASERPNDRETQRLLSTAYALEGTILAASGQSDAARAAWQKAVEAVEPFAKSSRDAQYLAPWARGLIELGRIEEARPVVFRLLSRGYGVREFLDLCAAHGLP